MIDCFKHPTKRILIVDDNSSIHNDYKQILKPSAPSTQLKTLAADLFEDPVNQKVQDHDDYELTFALQGEEGVEIVQQSLRDNRPFALAFVDMRMPPGMDGLETIENIWRLDPDIQAVICTAYSDYTYDQIARRFGKTGNLLILRKPYDNIEVAQMASSLCTKWEQNNLRRCTQERLELALKGANLGLWEWSFRTRRLVFDDPWLGIFGFDRPEIDATRPPWETLAHPEDLIQHKEQLSMHLNQHTPFYKVKLRMMTKSGRWRHLLERGKVMQRDPDGKPIHITGTHLDVTKHVQAQARIQESEEKWRSLILSAPEIIVMTDKAGNIISINRSFQGMEPYELQGKNIYDILNPVCGKPFLQCVDEVSNYLQSGHCPIESIHHKTGETIFYEAHIGPVKDSRGDLTAITMVITDITERKLMEEKIIQAKNAAEQANMAKSRFLATISHEIRTPLTALIGYSDLLLRNQLDPDQNLQWIKNLRTNADHLYTLVNDFLDLSKIEAGELKLRYEERDTVELFEEIFTTMQPIAVKNSIHLDIVYSDQIPKFFVTDPLRFRQILFNLISNAVKFTPKGSVKVYVGTTMEAGNCVLKTAVQDTGIGIAETELDTIFEPFTQLDMSDKRTYGGTGLGLDISRRLAVMLGAELSVSSNSGQGSTFEVRLPIGPIDRLEMIEPHEIETIRNEKRLLVELADRLHDTKILLVEDNPDNQQILQYFLRESGAQVDIAANGLIGLEKIEAAQQSERPYQLILMDMQMPVMDGFTATKKIRDRGYDLPIIALTAYTMSGDEDRCMESGCNSYLGKPISQNALISTILHHTDKTNHPQNNAIPQPTWKPESQDPNGLYSAAVTNPRFAKILEEYLDRLSQSVIQLEGIRKRNDLEGLAKMVHRLKGSAASYGYPEISNLAGICEKKLRESGGIEDIEIPLNRLINLMQSVSQAGSRKKIFSGEKSCCRAKPKITLTQIESPFYSSTTTRIFTSWWLTTSKVPWIISTMHLPRMKASALPSKKNPT